MARQHVHGTHRPQGCLTVASFEQYETKSAGKKWRVRYRTPDRRTTEKSGFRTKKEAETWARNMEDSKADGSYVSPSASKVAIGKLGDERLKQRQRRRKPSTMHSEESAWRVRVKPRWGNYFLSDVTKEEVEEWIADMVDEGLSRTSIGRAHGVLSGILSEAVDKRKLYRNVAARVEIPEQTTRRRNYLTHKQVALLAEQCEDPEHALIVRTLAYTGMRWGELTALQVNDLLLDRRQIQIDESATSVGGVIILGTTKNNSARVVGAPAHIFDELVRRTEHRGLDELVFSDGENFIKPSSSQQGWFAIACRRARAKSNRFPLRLSPHDLRHTYASLAVSAGANVKALQNSLGHQSAAMTLDRYADLLTDDVTTVANALDAALSQLD